MRASRWSRWWPTRRPWCRRSRTARRAPWPCARTLVADFDGSLVVLSGDCPLITADTIARLAAVREENDAAVVVLTMQLDDPFGYGRIVRDEQGAVARIVEQKDATPEEAAICECNSGFYCFDARALFDALGQVGNDNAQGEVLPHRRAGDLSQRWPSRVGIGLRRPCRVPGRELAHPAGRGHEAGPASHQPCAYGGRRDHDRPRAGMDRSGRGHRAGRGAAAQRHAHGRHQHRRGQRHRPRLAPDRHDGGLRLRRGRDGGRRSADRRRRHMRSARVPASGGASVRGREGRHPRGDQEVHGGEGLEGAAPVLHRRYGPSAKM